MEVGILSKEHEVRLAFTGGPEHLRNQQPVPALFRREGFSRNDRGKLDGGHPHKT
jgi:hypothetical protein